MSNLNRNNYMLRNMFRKKNGYDWWWHSFVGYERGTNIKKSFFIEYFIINPGIGKNEPVFGQVDSDQVVKPSYGMIKAGAWGSGKCQIHNFYPMKQVSIRNHVLEVKMGENYLSEKELVGSVSLSKEESENHPEYMSDPGSMSWNLKLDKKISYSIGYGGGKLSRALNLFEMFWHVQGMRTHLQGEIILNGIIYDVRPEDSYGYQDKNFGKDYTNPWVWLNSNNLYSKVQHKKLNLSSLVVGGGNPKVLNVLLGKKLIIAFNYEGHVYEYNFSKFWKIARTNFQVTENDSQVIWKVIGVNSYSKIVMKFTCDKKDMIYVNYESPKGFKDFEKLHNGGTAKGVIKLYEKNDGEFELFDTILAFDGGCEYGQY